MTVLPEQFHREIDMAQKTTNKDLSQIINQMKLVRKFFATTQVDDYKKCKNILFSLTSTATRLHVVTIGYGLTVWTSTLHLHHTLWKCRQNYDGGASY